ncbi:hypothetical protein TNCV_3660291 [Trichonephila clavipes]|nr:hypothetical protein TNCV_3660291 [Trichonephila clavipes]
MMRSIVKSPRVPEQCDVNIHSTPGDLAQLHEEIWRLWSDQVSNCFIYLSNARAWHLDHLTLSLPVPTDDVVIQEFVESSSMEQVVAIHSGMAVERVGFVSSQATPEEVQ